jgi:sugar phosphate isomerase/epimerase
MRPIGFSTGAISRHDFDHALDELRRHGVGVVELSALRYCELKPLVGSLQRLGLDFFDFVSFHAPSRIDPSDERLVIAMLEHVASVNIPIVVHPDIICTPELWLPFGRQLLIENMDKRKTIGRNARELERVFEPFPEAGLCFDIGHARQVDPTMVEARIILEKFSDRLAQVHISEVNTDSRHEPLSYYSIVAFQALAALIPSEIPVILETLIDKGQSDIVTEIERARVALPCSSDVVATR